MKPLSALVIAFALFAAPSIAGEPAMSLARPGVVPLELIEVAATWSCSPRKTCGKIRSCDEAYWYLYNCSWGHRLDRDSDGIPCESICQ